MITMISLLAFAELCHLSVSDDVRVGTLHMAIQLAAGRAFFETLGELFSQAFCLKYILWIQNIMVHYCSH